MMRVEYSNMLAGILGVISGFAAFASLGGASAPAAAEGPRAIPIAVPRIVAMRRLTESQYRNSIADVFGSDIVIAGRFEPIQRSPHQLIASGAGKASISPAGFEQFDSMARGIAAQVFDARHRAVFVACTPKSETGPDTACATSVLADMGQYVLRRRLNSDDLSLYTGIAGAAAERSGSFYRGLELALAAMLSSPEFLNVIDRAEPDPARPGMLMLDSYSRAARLSFFLWNTTPNKALLDAAASGRLNDQVQLEAIAGSMVRSPRLEQGVRAFFADMLMFEKFETISKDPFVFQRFNADVALAMPEQMQRMIADHLLTRHADYRELFTTRNTFMNRPLGALYRVRVRNTAGWEPYSFPRTDDRAGLTAEAGFLAMYAHPGRTSPTLRGKAVRELLLCEPVPDPPGNVNFTVVQDTGNPLFKTARERLIAHSNDATCAGCHKIMDPIGLTLEGYDGIGTSRSVENGAPIDVSGKLNDVEFSGSAGLGTALAGDPALTECAVSRMLEYALGRPVDSETEMLGALNKAFARSGYRFPQLMFAVASLPEAYLFKSGNDFALAGRSNLPIGENGASR